VKLVELVHGAGIDPETGDISLPIGNVTLNFSLEEWFTFANVIEEINTVLQMNTIENVMQCPACNTVATYIQYEEPSDEEIN